MSSVVLAPALITSRVRVVNKMIPMCIKIDEGNETILTQLPIAIGIIKDTTLAFSKFAKVAIIDKNTLQLTLLQLGEVPIRYGITVNTDSAYEIDIKDLINSLNLKKIGNIKVNNIRELIRDLALILTSKYKTYEIKPAIYFYVYYPKENIFTRVCWLDDINGNVDIYMSRSLTILVPENVEYNEKFVDKLSLDYLENYSPITVPDLIDKVMFVDKLNEIWNREIAKISREDAKKRIKQLLNLEEIEFEEEKESEEKVEETSKESDGSSESRVET